MISSSVDIMLRGCSCLLLLLLGGFSSHTFTSAKKPKTPIRTWDGGLHYDEPVPITPVKPVDCPDKIAWEALASTTVPSFDKCGKTYKNLTRFKEGNTGMHYANMGEFPSVVFITAELNFTTNDGKDKGFKINQCNGVLIALRYVLTAAHCLQPPPLPPFKLTKVVISIGDYNIEVFPRDCVSNEYNTTCFTSRTGLNAGFIIHPQYEPFSMHNDIALVPFFMANYVNMDWTDIIQPICLPHGCTYQAAARQYHEYVMAHVGWQIYWPNRNKTFAPRIVQKLKRIIKETSACEDAYLWMDSRTQLCTQDFLRVWKTLINCDAYTGGPLILQDGPRQFLVGIASFGEVCKYGRFNEFGDPLVFTWIAPYVEWILKSIYKHQKDLDFNIPFSETKWPTGDEDELL